MMSNSFDDFVDDTGNIVIREDLTLVRHVEQNVADNGDDLAYRYVDYSRSATVRCTSSPGRSSVPVCAPWPRACSR